jgi:hypothetical protein
MVRNKLSIVRSILASTLALGVLASASLANASVSSVTQGANCFPYGDATSASGLGNTGFARNGMTMTSTQNGGKLFLCPYPRMNAGSSGTVYMQFQYTRANPQNTGYMYCNAYTYDIYGNAIQGAFSGYIQTSGTSYAAFSGIPGTAWGPLGMTCYMGMNDIIRVLNTTEY